MREASAEKKRKEERKKITEENGKVFTGEKTRLPLPSTRDIIQNALRLFSIARIVVGVMVDGVSVVLLSVRLGSSSQAIQTVIVYWLSSATFGLLQTWAFNLWDARIEARRQLGTLPLTSNNSARPEAAKSSK